MFETSSKSKSATIALDIGEDEKDPAEFVDSIALAELAGFDVAWLGDHFMPWVHSGNKSASVWPLLGASLQATKKIKIGPYVTTPIGARYHPAIVAQASATLDNMFPGRLLLGVGTGEAMNEAPFLERWPDWNERSDRLLEGLRLMRELWKSPTFFDFEGKYFKMKQVFLYTKPKTSMEIYFSATGPKSAFNAGRFGDHLITLNSVSSLARLHDLIFSKFDEGMRSVGKDPGRAEKVVSIRYTFDDEKQFLKKAKARAAIMRKSGINEPDPRKIELLGELVSDEDLVASMNFCSGWKDLVEVMHKFLAIGATQLVLPTGPDKKKINEVALEILPYFKEE